MDLQVQFLSPDSSRAEIIGSLCAVNGEAKREMRVDSLGRPNERWADSHSFMNTLLDFLDE